ncbi:MAG TPA: hypothetical protein DCY40_01680 [Actinobacteria bacterium]|nr:hypothetical protein [Actinomycetota bacterium]
MRIATIALVSLVMAACATEAGEDQPTTTDGPTTSQGPTTTSGRQVVPPTTGAFEPVVGAVPEDRLEPLMADAAQKAGASIAAVAVIRAQQVVWSSTALDCPEPGMFYTQVLTNGYWVVLLAGDNEYDYRAAIDGEFRLCVGGAPPHDVLVDR